MTLSDLFTLLGFGLAVFALIQEDVRNLLWESLKAKPFLKWSAILWLALIFVVLASPVWQAMGWFLFLDPIEVFMNSLAKNPMDEAKWALLIFALGAIAFGIRIYFSSLSKPHLYRMVSEALLRGDYTLARKFLRNYEFKPDSKPDMSSANFAQMENPAFVDFLLCQDRDLLDQVVQAYPESRRTQVLTTYFSRLFLSENPLIDEFYERVFMESGSVEEQLLPPVSFIPSGELGRFYQDVIYLNLWKRILHGSQHGLMMPVRGDYGTELLASQAFRVLIITKAIWDRAYYLEKMPRTMLMNQIVALMKDVSEKIRPFSEVPEGLNWEFPYVGYRILYDLMGLQLDVLRNKSYENPISADFDFGDLIYGIYWSLAVLCDEPNLPDSFKKERFEQCMERLYSREVPLEAIREGVQRFMSLSIDSFTNALIRIDRISRPDSIPYSDDENWDERIQIIRSYMPAQPSSTP